jgi:hypothetical protein
VVDALWTVQRSPALLEDCCLQQPRRPHTILQQPLRRQVGKAHGLRVLRPQSNPPQKENPAQSMLGVYFCGYAAVGGEALSSISFSRASFVHCCALQRRNLRSASSLVRAAYRSHSRACSKHSAIVDDMTRRLNSGNKSGSAETCTNVAWRPRRGLER